jgi:hypothetical protein
MGNLRDPAEGRRTTAAVGDHGGGDAARRGMVKSRGSEIATLRPEHGWSARTKAPTARSSWIEDVA